MNPVLDAALRSWPFAPCLLLSLSLTAAIYLHGWLILHRRAPSRWHSWQPAAFLGGLATIYLALASPLEPFAAFFLQAHMAQHLLLLMAAPPLLWLGEPLFPVLRGLPAPVRIYWIAPLFRVSALRRFCAWLTHPVAAWLLFVGTTWLWHSRLLYELALRSDGWHYVQHLLFLGTGLLFWHPVVRPYPSRPRWSPWLLFPYLILADLQNTVLSALLTFSDRVLYPQYAEVPRLGGISALDDQAAAGVLMWVPGSLAYLLPLFWLGTRALLGVEGNVAKQTRVGGKKGGSPPQRHTASQRAGRLSLPLIHVGAKNALRISERWDLLRLPVLGTFLRWRHARLCLQLPLLLLAGVLICDGLTGPAVAPMNLAGVLPWIHWRGLLIFSLLIVGNVFCLACPFLVPRMLARRWYTPRFTWSRRLRNKWLAVVLLVLFLWSYEVFALWDSPWWTAWLAIGYFVGALVIDSFFRGAAFCKYLCPIGQFNFVQSLISPWEVKIRATEVCASCRTKDCIRGRTGTDPDSLPCGTPPPNPLREAERGSSCSEPLPASGRGGGGVVFEPLPASGRGGGGVAFQPLPASGRGGGGVAFQPLPASGRGGGGVPVARGCELNLFLPRKASNLDCTFCLDCIHACPHDNIGIVATTPAAELWHDPQRSGVGRFGKRPDLAALVLVLVFGAFANAAGMVAPVIEWQDWLKTQWGMPTLFWPLTFGYLLALVIIPLLAIGGAAWLSRWWGRLATSWLETATRYSYTLVPLGFAMWLSHYSFHLLTSYDTALPVAQRFAADLGVPLGEPQWTACCCTPVGNWLPRLEIVFLDLGLLLALHTSHRLALATAPNRALALRALLPWAALMLLLFALGIWLVLQPMQMRGTLLLGG